MSTIQQALIPETRKKPVEQSLEVFERALTNPKVDGNNIALILEAMQNWQKELARQEFIESRKAFQDLIQPPKRTRQVKIDMKSGGVITYAHPKMASSLEEIRKCISPYGFSVTWIPGSGENGKVRVTCILSHVLGHEVSGYLDAPPETSGSKNPVQAVASTVTMLQRYTIFPLLGIVPEDQPDTDGKPPGGTMDEQAVRDWISAMEACTSEPQLRKTYIESINAAKSAGDKEASAKFEEFKNQRKAQLQVRK